MHVTPLTVQLNGVKNQGKTVHSVRCDIYSGRAFNPAVVRDVIARHYKQRQPDLGRPTSIEQEKKFRKELEKAMPGCGFDALRIQEYN